MKIKLIFALFIAALLVDSANSFAFTNSQQSQAERVIVIGMDGMDAEMTNDWMDAGHLPNFSRLRAGGTFAEFMPANPAQSPVSWASINTGRNPGKHGIYDFVGISREGGRRFPVMPGIGFQNPVRLSAVDAGLPYAQIEDFIWIFVLGGFCTLLGGMFILRRQKLFGIICIALGAGGAYGFYFSWQGAYPEGKVFPEYESLNLADNFWVELDNAGVPFRGQGTIVSYPTEELQYGKLVAGLGAPDATGGLNSSAIYTTAKERVTSRRTVKPSLDGASSATVKIYLLDEDFRSKLYGPEDTSVDISVVWNKGSKISLTVDGVTQEIELNNWSEFYQVEFVWTSRFSTWALVRFWVEERNGELEIFASPLQVDPEHPTPGNRTSWPQSFALELQERIGRFETLGWACQTHAVKDAELSDDAFLGDIEFTLDWRKKMLRDAIEIKDWKVLFHFFGTPDRICHMLMRHMDPLHPQYDEELANREVEYFGRTFMMKDAALVIYQEMDKIVGWMLDDVLGIDDVMMIISDHGFDSFRRQVDLNAWLAKEGFLSLANYTPLGIPKTSAQMKKSTLRFVDWNNTQAYSIAIGKIYLNLVGREAKGFVSPEDSRKVLDEIVNRLYEMQDPLTGEKIVKKVYLRENLYDGPYVKESDSNPGAAEITIDFVKGYRASWNVTGGGITLVDGVNEDGDEIALPGEFVTDNDYAWSGDHCGVDIHSVQGIFFSNKALSLPKEDTFYDSTHLAPTVLDLMNVSIPSDYDKEPLILE
jgi:predicted AlkP superfamily phosphohydrolase/phosphomutase